MNRKELVSMAKELNEVLGLDPKIKTSSKVKIEELKHKVAEAGALLEDRDKVSQATMDLLLDLEVDVSAGVRVLKSKPTASKKSSVSKKSNVKKSPGVIQTIVDIIDSKGPITKDQILKVLTKKFPDRNPEGMGRTIHIQVPNRLNREKNIKIKEGDNGYYIK